jgi:hypothetical protein
MEQAAIESSAPTESTAAPEVTHEQIEASQAAPSEQSQTESAEEHKEEPKVNLGALHEERAKRRQLQAEAAELRQKLAAQHEQLAQRIAYIELLAQRQQSNQKPIDYNEDPVAFLATQNAQIQEKLEAQEREKQEQRQANWQQEQTRQFVAAVNQSEAEFAKSNPDYLDAIAHAKSAKAREYMAVGYTQEQAQQLVLQDAAAIAQRAIQFGENPAEMAYNLAKTMGYKPKPNAEKKLEMMAEGQKAAKPSSGSAAFKGATKLEQIANMSVDEFAKATEGDNWAKLMGG